MAKSETGNIATQMAAATGAAVQKSEKSGPAKVYLTCGACEIVKNKTPRKADDGSTIKHIGGVRIHFADRPDPETPYVTFKVYRKDGIDEKGSPSLGFYTSAPSMMVNGQPIPIFRNVSDDEKTRIVNFWLDWFAGADDAKKAQATTMSSQRTIVKANQSHAAALAGL